MTAHGKALRAELLATLRAHGGPMSAYTLLACLQHEHPKIAPPTIYRALAALLADGKVHRLGSLNAYVACQWDRHMQASILSICDDCGTVEESVAPDLLDELSSVAGKSGFRPARHVIEIHGLCASCGAGHVPA